MRNTLLILILLAICLAPVKSSAQVVLKTDTIDVACGSNNVFLVPVRVRNFTDIAGLQFTFQWNAANLAYQYITDIDPNFTGIAFDSTTLISQGKFTFAWSQLNSLTLPDDGIVLQVAFKRIGGPASVLQFTDDPTAIFAFDGAFNDIPVTTLPGLVKPMDSAPPAINCPPSVTVQSTGPAVVNGIAPLSATDDCGTPVVGWTSAGATNASFPADPDASGATFNLGASQVTYTATDVVGHTATCTFNVTVEFAIGDDLTFLPVVPAVSCGDTVSINVTTYNFDTIAAFQYSMGWDPAQLHYLSVSNLNPTLNLTMANFGTGQTGSGIFSIGWDGPLSGTNLPDGAVVYTLTFQVLGAGTLNFTDNPTNRIAFAGPNFPPVEIPMVTVNVPVTVTDTLPPAITCPANVTVQAPGSVAVQNIAPAALDDNCAGPVVGWSSIGATNDADPNDPDASGTVFNQGVSTVTYTATDAGGNTATCAFNVDVEFGAGSTDLTLFAGNTSAACGGMFSIDVTVLNFDSIAGLQFSMGWDTAAMHYASVSNFNPALNLTSANFGETFINIGQFSFGWTGPINGLDLTDGEVLFTLNFQLAPNSSGGMVDFTDIPTSRQAFSGASFPPVDIPLMTFAGQVTVADNQPPTITCPANVSVMATSGSITADVTGLDPLTLQDNCSANPTLSYAQSGATGNSGSGNANGTYNAGTTTVTYTATDDAGNTATCFFTVTVDAGTPLVLHSGVINADCQGAAQVKNCITVDNFTDIIGLQFGLAWDKTVLQLVPPVTNVYPGLTVNNGMFFSYSTANNGLFLFFGSILTWPDIPTGDTLFCLNFNVLNPAGTTDFTFQDPINAVNASFAQVPVDTTNGSFSSSADNTPPVVTCPPDQMVAPPATECTATFDPPLPMATDACGSIDTTFRSPAGNAFDAGVTVVTYTVSDQAGNTSTCTFNVTVTDSNPPQMFNCPANITVNAAPDECNAAGGWSPPLFTDCSSITITSNFTPTDLLPSCAPNTIVYEATDFFGNTTTCQFTVLVVDVTPPVITCPTDITVFPVNSCDTTVTFPMATATDACDINVDIAGDANSGDVFPPGQTIVTFAALDDCDNLAQCTFMITVVDGAPPTIHNCPTDVTVQSDPSECGANVDWTEPTADDLCDALVNLTSSDMPGAFFGAGAPIVVTYTATDDSGNEATCTFTVTVQDVTPPSLTGCPQGPFLLTLPTSVCDTVLNWTPPVASDNCGLVNLTTNFDPGFSFPTGDTMVVYTATDQSGNTATCSFRVVVRDIIPPVIMGCPSSQTVDPNGACTVPVFWDEPTATDNCSVPTLSSQYHSGDEFPIGVTLVQILAQDASSNYDTCTFMVTVLGMPPGFDLATIPQNVVTNTACDTTLSWNMPVAIGFCNNATVTSDSISPATFGPGVHVVTFTATDGITTVTASFTVTVSEHVAPVMLCPSNPVEVNTSGVIVAGQGFITAADTVSGCLGAELTFALPQATDNCTPIPVVTQTAGTVSGGAFALGSHTLTFVAEDAAGNTSECSVTVNIVPAAGVNPVADPNPGCANEMVVITATSVPNATYVWAQLPQTILASTTNQYTIPALNAQTAGLYAVSAIVNGCPSLPDTVDVTLIAAPQPVNDQFTIAVGALDTFNVFLNDGINPADYEICQTLPDPLPAGLVNIGGGNFVYQEQSGQDVSFSYQICYCGQAGEMATATIHVDDTTACSFIPNIITPNGDDINDWFTIPCLNSRNFTNNSLVIYNQWGDKVFESKGYTNDPNDPVHPAWRGTLNGQPGKDLPDGVYYYLFQPSPSDKVMKGFVEIFR